MHQDDTCPDGAVRIPLRARDGSIRAYVIVDAADAEWVNQWTWRLTGDGGYAYRYEGARGTPRHVFLHRELMGLPRRFEGREVDHEDRNKLNCRRRNMRVLPKGKNPQNVGSRPGSVSVYRGVYLNRRSGKWVAQINVSRQKMHLGTFASELDAANAAREARRRLMPFSTD